MTDRRPRRRSKDRSGAGSCPTRSCRSGSSTSIPMMGIPRWRARRIEPTALSSCWLRVSPAGRGAPLWVGIPVSMMKTGSPNYLFVQYSATGPIPLTGIEVLNRVGGGCPGLDDGSKAASAGIRGRTGCRDRTVSYAVSQTAAAHGVHICAGRSPSRITCGPKWSPRHPRQTAEGTTWRIQDSWIRRKAP